MEYYSMPSTISLDAGMGVNSGAGVWGIISLVLAIVGAFLIYFLFVKSKTEPKNNFLKRLKDFLAFKTMWIEPMVKMLYYFLTILVILTSFSLISVSFASFCSTLILGPIVIRFAYELIMILIKIWHNTSDIAKASEKKKA